MAPRPNVFSVRHGAPFLDTLVGALLDGRLIAGWEPHDPFALADLTIYLPTRRAARAIRDSFLARTGRPTLLPRIRTLGDLDEDDPAGDFAGPELPPAIAATERQLVLTNLVLQWSGAMARQVAGLPDEELLVPSSPADAARLAGALGGLIDQVGTDPASWAGLFSGMDADLARYWEITIEFLRIATQAWPGHLAERGLLDPGARRDLLLRGEAARLDKHGSRNPVIAAGSTGSVPATAALLAAIARLPNGAVVLPGLDRNLDPESWDEIGPSDREPAGAGHPQHGLKQLLFGLGCRREDVEELGHPSPPLVARSRIVSEAMRPAGTTERWSEGPMPVTGELAQGFRDIGIVDAANEREEAIAAALILREAAEQPGKVAALVTPDRGLARRVAVELSRWGIRVDDSGGRPLTKAPPGVFARLVAEVALDGCRAEALLALLKHPLASFGLETAEARRAARALERAILRGPRLNPGLPALRDALAHAATERWTKADGKRRDFTAAAWALSRSDWDRATDLVARVESALAPLEACASRRSVPLAELVEAHRSAVLAAAEGPTGNANLLSGEAGDALAQAFDELGSAAPAGPDLRPADYPSLFSALIERSVVRRRGGLDPRIHIWGALEARLQSVDVVVLGGLNEGVWPGQTRLDPLLSRPMRAALELEPPERRIGLSAHDFAQAMGQPVVWITRADRQDNEPRVASRWLQRLSAYAGEETAKAMRARGAEKLALARLLDAPRRFDAPVRPSPVPPLERRPARLSATRIETLIRDPYAIYASSILGLNPFDAIASLPGAIDRGNLVHAILEDFIGEHPRGPYDGTAEQRLMEIGRAHFDRYAEFPEIETLWWPRFRRIAKWFIGTEAEGEDVAERLIERTGSIFPLPGFELSARADRLDRLTDGRIRIIDYKTGTPPGADEVLTLAPQLPLEALIVQQGGFAELGPAEVANLDYYHISGRGEGGLVCLRGERDTARGKPAQSLAETIAITETRLKELIAFYQDPEAGYLSQKIPKNSRYRGDYDHLARVDEWALAEGPEDA